MLPVPWQIKIAAPAVCALIVLLAAACGGGDAKPSASANATQQSGAGANSNTPKPQDTGTSAATQTSNATAPPGGLVDACTLLTKAEITDAVGETTDGKVTNDPPTSACFWDSTDDLMTTKVELLLYLGSNAQYTSDYYDIFTGDAVNGIGEKAKWVQSVGTLEALRGNYDVAVSVMRPTSMTEVDQQNISKGLAQKILARLP